MSLFAAPPAITEIGQGGRAATEAAGRVMLAWLSTHGLRILVAVLIGWVVLRAARLLERRILSRGDDHDPSVVSERERRAQTVAQILDYTAKVFVFLVVSLVVLRELGADVLPLLTGAGIFGVALGFGAQSIVRDVLTGLFILTENQYRVGDVVEIAGKSGVVETINLRTTILRGADGAVHFVPNGQIAVSTNRTMRWSKAVIDLRVDFDDDVERVEKVLGKVFEEMRADPTWGPELLEPPELIGPEQFNETSYDLRILVKTSPSRQWDVARQLRRRIQRAFLEAGIATPVPQRIIRHRPDEATRGGDGGS